MSEKALHHLFLRDLDRLRDAMEAYTQEAEVWKVGGSISNAAGNLCLHLCGNLRHFVGHLLGGIVYSRDREREFGARDLPLAELLHEVELSRSAVDKTFVTLSSDALKAPYPLRVLDREWSTDEFLLHLYGHLNYHLGQIDYHRRIMG
jgi:uncharacterized damage-inducible protein DinB